MQTIQSIYSLRILVITFVWLMLIISTPITMAAGWSAQKVSENPEKTQLFESLKSANSELEGREAENAIWRFWFAQAPTPQVRTLLDSGRERREAYDFEAAEGYFDDVVKLAPEYAEGYNQRAYARFLRENYADAQSDLEIALQKEPRHFGALSGLYHILMIQNRPEAAFGHLLQAVKIHPWLKERTALPESLREGIGAGSKSKQNQQEQRI